MQAHIFFSLSTLFSLWLIQTPICPKVDSTHECFIEESKKQQKRVECASHRLRMSLKSSGILENWSKMRLEGTLSSWASENVVIQNPGDYFRIKIVFLETC